MRLASAAIVVGLIGAACTSDEPGAAPSDLNLSSTCVMAPDGAAPTITVAHPDGWRLDDCGAFDPEAGDGAPTDPMAVDISWSVVDEDYREATDLSQGSSLAELPTVHQQMESVVAGHQAVRLVTERSGDDGPWPEGTETTQWFVDLDLAGEATGSRPVLVGTVADTEDVDHAAAVDVLDEMAYAIEVDDREDLDGVVVARREAGAAPWEVAFEDDCLRLYALSEGREQVDEVCDTGQDGVTAGYLHGDAIEVPVVAGTAPAETDLVRFEDQGAHGAVPVPGDRTGFAFETPADETRTLLARTFDGEDIDSATVEPITTAAE